MHDVWGTEWTKLSDKDAPRVTELTAAFSAVLTLRCRLCVTFCMSAVLLPSWFCCEFNSKLVCYFKRCYPQLPLYLKKCLYVNYQLDALIIIYS